MATSFASSVRFIVVLLLCTAAVSIVASEQSGWNRQLFITCLALAGVVVTGVCLVVAAVARNEKAIAQQSPEVAPALGPSSEA